MIDIALILVAVQMLTGIAYKLTDGRVQGSAGIAMQYCSPLQTLPQLTPPPMANLNFAVSCQRSLPGLTIASSITIGKQEKLSENTFRSEIQSYPTNASGQQVNPILVVTNFHAAMVVMLYVFLSEWLAGSTVGKRLMGLRTVGARSNRGPSLVEAAMRHGLMNVVPLGLILVLYANQSGLFGVPASISIAGHLATWFLPICAVWILFNLNLILRNGRALFDRVSGTDVIKT